MTGRTNVAGVSSKGLPEFTYSGDFLSLSDGGDNWRIKFLTSGTLNISRLKGAKNGVDVFLVGGGAGGHYGGGGGGYCNTGKALLLAQGQDYTIVVGAGGGPYTAGGESSAFGVKAAGGCTLPNSSNNGANGGSGGGAAGTNIGGAGGADGNDGTPVSGRAAGSGQRTVPGPNGETGSTREFGEETGDLYAGGGGGCQGKGGGAEGGAGGSSDYGNAGSGEANTGGGGGGTYSGTDGSGGSGIVIIRNARGAA